MRVVFAIQAPTLLNRLALSKHWTLEVADLGDSALAERARLTVPRYESGEVHAVFVATPDHLLRARERWPQSKHVWCAHNGRADIVAEIGLGLPILTFSRRTAALQQAAQPRVKVAAIRPCYTPNPIWSWERDKFWYMLSRPETRRNELPAANRYVLERSGVRCVAYGENQPGGFLTDPSELMRSCSGYLSSLQYSSGFGLAQHECFAAGVPLVCSRWGDSVEEISPDYSSLHDDLDAQAAALTRLATDEAFAKAMSELGLQYIAERRTQSVMDLEVEQALATL
jgi:hypothetical protein